MIRRKAMMLFGALAMNRRTAIFCLAAAFFLITDACGRSDEAVDAVQRFDYATATRELAEQGDPNAQYTLGVMLREGIGVERNYQEAMNWSQRAAEQGYADAQSDIGAMYATGLGVKQDYEEAVKWYRRAADQGFARAQSNLGSMYFGGMGVRRDYREAAHWFQKAADQNLPDAQSNLGVIHAMAGDYTRAAHLFRKATEQTWPVAMDNLGSLNLSGQGVPKNYVSAYMWFELALSFGMQHALEGRDKAAAAMTPEQIVEAKRLVEGWLRKRNN
jgi:uncharacterized protein